MKRWLISCAGYGLILSGIPLAIFLPAPFPNIIIPIISIIGAALILAGAAMKHGRKKS